MHQTLKIKSCKDISKVRNIMSFDKVVICESPKLKDISALDYELSPYICICKEVVLNDCSNIEDISPLKHMKRVTIIRCDNVVDLSPLAKAKEVTLYWCDRIKDVSSLSSVEHLYVNTCFYLEDICTIEKII